MSLSLTCMAGRSWLMGRSSSPGRSRSRILKEGGRLELGWAFALSFLLSPVTP